MQEDSLEKLKKKLESRKGSENDPSLRLLEKMDDMDQKGVLFHLEQLIGKKLSEFTDKESLRKSLSSISIPVKIWKTSEFAVLPEDINTKKGIEDLADFIYSEVLIHKILDLPFSPNWEKLANEKVGLDDKEVIRKFWEGVKIHKVPIKDAMAALARIGIIPESSPIFDLE